MCRIVGYLNFDGKSISESVLLAMRDSLIHGGPDGGGYFTDGNIGLGHRRLSILDLSDAGSQPMIWNQWVIVYNGEVYNFSDIREKLIDAGYAFQTQTDTEVIIKAFDCWGRECVHHFRGMFVFAFWNKDTRKLFLCRDRIGVKPLYWYKKGNLFLFASELKAFYQHPSFIKEINKKAIPHYLEKGYIHAKESIFSNVYKLPAGCFLDFDENNEVYISRYWDAEDIYAKSIIDKRDEDIMAAQLEIILKESFNLRMISDVDVGIFLSGGIDSSLVTALLQSDSDKPLKTYTIGFQDKDYNESDSAQEIAGYLGTDHTTLYCTQKEFKDTITLIPDIYDEPFGDASAIPTYLLSRMARKNVKVALSGDGADELFGGYTKYAYGFNAKNLLFIPYSLRKIVHHLSLSLNADIAENIITKTTGKSYNQFTNKYLKFQQTLIARNIDELFDFSSSYALHRTIQMLTNYNQQKITFESIYKNDASFITYFGMRDIISYLPGDILTKVDRASMSVALECREPFLDPKVIEFAFSIPDHLKIKNGQNKYLLRKILAKYIPTKLTDRPKQGFSVPIDQWMRSILLEDLTLLENDKYFFDLFGLNQVYFKEIMNNFLSNKNKYNPNVIWFMYCLYLWYKKWL